METSYKQQSGCVLLIVACNCISLRFPAVLSLWLIGGQAKAKPYECHTWKTDSSALGDPKTGNWLFQAREHWDTLVDGALDEAWRRLRNARNCAHSAVCTFCRAGMWPACRLQGFSLGLVTV